MKKRLLALILSVSAFLGCQFNNYIVSDLNSDGEHDRVFIEKGSLIDTLHIQMSKNPSTKLLIYPDIIYETLKSGDYNHDNILDITFQYRESRAINRAVLYGEGNGKFKDPVFGL